MFLKPRKIVVDYKSAYPIKPRETLKKIINSIKPIYLVCTIIGLNSSVLKNGRIQKAKKFDWIYFGLFMTAYTIISIYSIYMIIFDKTDLKINKNMTLIEVLIMTVLMIVVVAATFTSRRLTIKSLQFMANIDVSFFKNNFFIDYSNLLRKNYMILIYVMSSVAIRLVLMLMTLNFDVIQQLTIFVAALIKAITKYQFVVIILQLQMRFDKINKVIMGFYANKSKLILDPNSKGIHSQLYTLCRLHYKLADVIQKINSAFAIQLLCSIGVSLFDILFQAYCLYFVSVGKTDDESSLIIIEKILCPVCWLIDEAIEIYWLVYACASTCDNANETPTILHELRNKSFDIELETDIQTYSLQMLHQKVQFSVLGFFVVDYTLIYSILGAVTTYLVIFIQFDQSSGEDSALQDLNSTFLEKN